MHEVSYTYYTLLMQIHMTYAFEYALWSLHLVSLLGNSYTWHINR